MLTLIDDLHVRIRVNGAEGRDKLAEEWIAGGEGGRADSGGLGRGECFQSLEESAVVSSPGN